MKVLEYSARAIALFWAAFWTLFFIAESIAWHTPPDRMAMWVGLGVLFMILALVAWRWEVGGAIFLIAAGLVVAAAYAVWGPRDLPLAARIATLVAFGVPPTIAGALFLLHHHESRA